MASVAVPRAVEADEQGPSSFTGGEDGGTSGHGASVCELARSTFRLATGRWSGPLFSKEVMEELRGDWFNMLTDPIRAHELVPNQPFFLRAMSQTLQLLEDPDFEVLEHGKFCFCNGVEVGHTRPLGPRPQVYRRRVKGQKYDDSLWEPEMKNYKDGPEVAKALQPAFEKEELEGRMFPLSVAEAQRRYPGEALRIAAQAVIPKQDQDFWVVHDGTHGVRVNNEIVVRDRLESPGSREVGLAEAWGCHGGEGLLRPRGGCVQGAQEVPPSF
ncbi:unnamed protein product [Symbiodinium natans]|uniref:Uncharacterized protein n=1 Tax=Symbiodinium natans TaxID=878477 RepID=A0A812HAJ1_9DINO|nr:unnamed protein product [Symbiodinium natans]